MIRPAIIAATTLPSGRQTVLLDRECRSLTLPVCRADAKRHQGSRVYYATPAGPVYLPSSLLSVGQDAKTAKSIGHGWLSSVCYLSPWLHARIAVQNGYGYDLMQRAGLSWSGVRLPDVCPYATPGCIVACLNTAGRGAMSRIQAGRVNKTLLYAECRRLFRDLLSADIAALARKARKLGLTPTLRPNGTSDLPLLRGMASDIAKRHAVVCYDYTKNAATVEESLAVNRYDRPCHLTLSWSGENENAARRVISMGGNVALPFYPTVPVGDFYLNAKIVDGDSHDVRTPDTDGAGVIVGLKYKKSAGVKHATWRDSLHSAMQKRFVLPTIPSEQGV